MTTDGLDPRPYLEILPELQRDLPSGAYRFASDPDHYDVASAQCVHDLEFGRLTFSDEESGVVELELVGNQWKHEGNLVLRYWGFRSSRIAADAETLGHRCLGDLMLDEIVPYEGGALHEMAFEGGTVEIVADDLTHWWVTRSSDQFVYVFTPEGGRYPAGVWSTESEAQSWIAIRNAKGMLSKYALGSSAYDAAVGRGRFRPKQPGQTTSDFVARFTTPIDHWHHTDEANR
jgi:hypothetical protein